MDRPSRIRISLVDRAGALGQAAGVLGLHGGNIKSIDVHDATGELVVDDVVVEFASPPDNRDLHNDLINNAGARLVASEAADDLDLVVVTLDQVHALLSEARADGARLGDSVAAICGFSTTYVAEASEAEQSDLGREALEHGRPVFRTIPDVPAPLEGGRPGDRAVMAFPLGDRSSPEAVLFVARPPEVEFTETEIARISALIRVHDWISGTSSGDR
jgi:hypothetical protein